MASPRSVESSVRVYKVLIKAYPASFRGEYGDEMALVFREQIIDAVRQRGAVGLITAWLRVLGDLARSAPEEHFQEMQRRIEMKNAALAILSVVVAAIAYVVIFFVGEVGMLGLTLDSPGPIRGIAFVAILILSAFLAGLILADVKPFFTPVATVPLGTMAFWLIWGLGVHLSDGPSWLAPEWGTLVIRLGFVASVGLASLLGCIVAMKASNRPARFSVPWFQLVAPLAVLVCTSFLTVALRLALHHQLESDLRIALGRCLFALFVIAAATIASMVHLVVRDYRKAAVH
jgi:hypothetical protein